MVDFNRFKREGELEILRDGIFVISRRYCGDWKVTGVDRNFYTLYIENKNKVLTPVGVVEGDRSLETILNLIEYGQLFPNNILQ